MATKSEALGTLQRSTAISDNRRFASNAGAGALSDRINAKLKGITESNGAHDIIGRPRSVGQAAAREAGANRMRRAAIMAKHGVSTAKELAAIAAEYTGPVTVLPEGIAHGLSSPHVVRPSRPFGDIL